VDETSDPRGFSTLSIANASNAKLVNRPKMSVFVKLYKNQGVRGKIPNNQTTVARNTSSYTEIGQCSLAKVTFTDRQTDRQTYERQYGYLQ